MMRDNDKTLLQKLWISSFKFEIQLKENNFYTFTYPEYENKEQGTVEKTLSRYVKVLYQ